MVREVVVIEDDINLSKFLKDLIHNSLELNVNVFNKGVEGLNYCLENNPDIVLIDLMLGDIHGKSICEEIRKKYPTTIIIILTADNTSQSLVACLNAGADDYISKPFHSEELIARINTKIRYLNSEGIKSQKLQFKDIEIDPETLEVKKAGELLKLTTKEFELLKYLISNSFRVCTREKILFSVWGYSSEVDTRVVDVHIAKLRKKLEDKDERYIQSMRSYGYRMSEDIS